ncbi:MAG: hypothetical protein ACI4JQ_04265 [Ruminococcus sp.]
MKKAVENILSSDNIGLAFAAGLAIGTAIGAVCGLFSKGIVVGSYNGCENKVSADKVSGDAMPQEKRKHKA